MTELEKAAASIMSHPKHYIIETMYGYIAQGSLLNFTDDFTQAKKYRKLIKAKTDAGEFKPATILDENGCFVLEMLNLSKNQKKAFKKSK